MRKDAAHHRKIAIDGGRLVALCSLTLADGPHNVSCDFRQHLVPEVRVQVATDALHVADASQCCLDFEIPNYRLLP